MSVRQETEDSTSFPHYPAVVTSKVIVKYPWGLRRKGKLRKITLILRYHRPILFSSLADGPWAGARVQAELFT